MTQLAGNPGLFEQFVTAESLAAFWDKPEPEQRQLWGESLNLDLALQNFEPRSIGPES